MMCKVLHLNRSTVYKIFKHQMSDREIRRLELESKIIEIYNEFDSIYGAPKIRRELIKQGYYASLKRVSVYMRRLELRSIITKKYKPGSTSKAPDDKENIMNQDFTTLYPNQKWVMDITYIWTVYDGWTYLASVMDLHSKMIIGYSYQRHMKQEIVLESLRQAVYKTKQTKGIIVQSDLGSQYLSYDVEQFIENYEMIHSYSRKGTPYDNAPIETFHSIIKRERLSRMVLKTFEEAKLVIFEYIEGFYNRKRIHSSIDYQTPYQVYYSK